MRGMHTVYKLETHRAATVGVQSITRFLKKNVFCRNLFQDTGMIESSDFVCLKDLHHGYHLDLKKFKKV